MITSDLENLIETIQKEKNIPRDVVIEILEGAMVAAARKKFGMTKDIEAQYNPDLGEAQEEIDADFSGEAFSIGFNARYLLDCLGVVGSKEIRLGLQDPNAPAQVRPTDDDATLAVVMPMRI